jgi:endogenous inhibitor of DNA gyrase (YacG/DUF329 family)
MKCPTCGKPSDRPTAGKAYPFCGERCWAIDLGKWLGEEFRVPDERESPPTPSSSGSGDGED